MPLEVVQRQVTETWYELGGSIEARELFPTLLPNSESVMEIEGDITTEHEVAEGKYDGSPADEAEMEDEIAEVTESAKERFAPEALTAAKAKLMELKPEATLLHSDLEEAEETAYEEAAKELGITIPWDSAEAAQIAEEEARRQQRHEEEERRKKETPEVLEKARSLFNAGNSHTAVRRMFPNHKDSIAKLVGEMRSQGVHIAR